ncbi:16S rRNA (guanine(966)-N(2))-methyltransferase RsmD [Desulfarculus baarsii]
MLKVCGGELRGRGLKAPAGHDTRPTAAKVRQALFNILAGRVPGARVCDLFAGSGALGVEALSRGAAWCLFVERRRLVCRLIAQNLAGLGLEARGRVLMADAAMASQRLLEQGPFDLALADPPYGQGFVARLARLAARPGFLAPGGVLVIEHAPGEAPPQTGLAIIDHRAYGQTELTFLGAPAAPAGDAQ